MSNLDQIKANYHTFYNQQKYEDSIVRQHASHWKKRHIDYQHDFENKSYWGQLRQATDDMISTWDKKTYGALGLIPFADALLLPVRIDATAQRMKGDHYNIYSGKIEKRESTLSGATEIGMNTVFAGLGAGVASGSAKRVAAGAAAGLAAGGVHGYAQYLDAKDAAAVPGLTDDVNRGAVYVPSEHDKKHAKESASDLDNIAYTQGIPEAIKMYHKVRKWRIGKARKAYDQYKQQKAMMAHKAETAQTTVDMKPQEATTAQINAMMAQRGQKAQAKQQDANAARVKAALVLRVQKAATQKAAFKARGATVGRINAMMAQKNQKAATQKSAFKAQGATIDRINAMMAQKNQKAAAIKADMKAQVAQKAQRAVSMKAQRVVDKKAADQRRLRSVTS